LSKHSGNRFDLVLVDMVMPRMDGLELLSRLRESSGDTRALLMTGYGVIPGKSEDGTDVIPKPFDLDTLAKAVKTSLTSPGKETLVPEAPMIM